MSKIDVIVLQKSQSPLRDLVDAALGDDPGSPWRRLPKQLPPPTMPDDTLVLWDLCGYTRPEVETMATHTSLKEAPLVLASLGVGDLERLALEGAAPLGLVVAPPNSLAVEAALRVAWSTQRRILELKAEQERLERAWADREVIERAKAVLMAARGLSESQAMRRLQKHARDHNQKLPAVARQVLAAHQVFDEEDL